MSVEITSDRKDRSLKHVLTDLRADAGLLVRQEIALAKTEVKEKVASVAKQAAMLGAFLIVQRARRPTKAGQ